MPSIKSLNPHDELMFDAAPLVNATPDRMASLGRLFGMQPVEVDHCRVLELGCSGGGHLLPLAERYPASTFVGVDFSPRAIETARNLAREIELSNVELHSLSWDELDDRLGQFDYIICRDMFSHVAASRQETILDFCRARLHPRGIAYVGYNVYPRWHLSDVLRDMMQAGSTSTAAQAQRAIEARRVLQFFSIALATEQSAASKLLKFEVDQLLSQGDAEYHQHYLTTENHPLYFYEFFERAAGQGLQYLAEANLVDMFASRYPPPVVEKLMRLAPNQVAMEQHIDLLRFRSLHESLLCHADIAVNRNLSPASLEGLWFAGRLSPQNPTLDVQSRASEDFTAPGGIVISIDLPPAKAALAILGSAWPRAMSLDELQQGVAARLAAEPAAAVLSATGRDVVGHILVQCLSIGAVVPYSRPDGFAATAGERPRVDRLAQRQSLSGRLVTNRRHETVKLDDLSQSILRYLDGQHDRAALVGILSEATKRGALSMMIGGVPAGDGEQVVSALASALERCLARLAYNALLVE